MFFYVFQPCFPLTNAAFLVAEVRQEGAETTAKAPKEGHAPAERRVMCVVNPSQPESLPKTQNHANWRFLAGFQHDLI